MTLFVKWAAEGAVKCENRVFCNAKGCVSSRGYVSILKVHGFSVNQGGTADSFIRP